LDHQKMNFVDSKILSATNDSTEIDILEHRKLQYQKLLQIHRMVTQLP